MKRAALLLTLLLAIPARAHHVVWLDFQELDLAAFPIVNGHAPTPTDLYQVTDLVFTKVVQDFAPYDIYFTTVRPANGRFTRVRILGWRNAPFFGCSGASCCAVDRPSCTGVDSWDDVDVSAADVYAGELAAQPEFRGEDATSARIATAIANIASHELGHIFGLTHCDAFNDADLWGCADIERRSEDINVFSHVMSAGGAVSSAGIPLIGDRDLFFEPHTSRRRLLARLQTRNHYQPLPDLNGDGRADVVTGQIVSRDLIFWIASLSNGTSFDAPSIWRSSGGRAGDVFLLGDVDGDRRDDLVYRRMTGDLSGHWFVRRSRGDDFGREEEWASSAGLPGDRFRLGDVNGDGRVDLVFGRPTSPTIVTWFVRPSLGTRFGVTEIWADDAGDRDDLFFVADVDGDGDDDLAYTRVRGDEARWFVRRSDRISFGRLETWSDDAGGRGYAFLLGDVGGDRDADLVYGHLVDSFRVEPEHPRPFSNMNWLVRPAEATRFGALQRWGRAGDPGEMLRLGDGERRRLPRPVSRPLHRNLRHHPHRGSAARDVPRQPLAGRLVRRPAGVDCRLRG